MTLSMGGAKAPKVALAKGVSVILALATAAVPGAATTSEIFTPSEALALSVTSAMLATLAVSELDRCGCKIGVWQALRNTAAAT